MLEGGSMDYEALSRQYVLNAVRRPKSLILERAEGSRMWDVNGKLYLDTMSGSAGPAMVGHAHAAVPAAGARLLNSAPEWPRWHRKECPRPSFAPGVEKRSRPH